MGMANKRLSQMYDHQPLPTSTGTVNGAGASGDVESRGKFGTYECVPDMSGIEGSGRIYQVGPSVAELRSFGAGVAAAIPCFVVYDADGIAQLPLAGDPPDGVAVAAETIGQSKFVRVVLMTDCLSYVTAGAAVASGARLKTDVNGKGVTAGAGDQNCAIALKAATGIGIVIPVRLCRGKVA